MTEIKLQLEGESTPQWLANNLRARADELAEIAAGASARALRALAASIEEQTKPAVQEPTETFSVVKARDKQRDDSGLFWTRINGGWIDDKEGRHRAWHLLDVVEVLRVGVGELELEPLASWETELLQLQDRREVAAAVLGAMDVDQYLIDAVVNARPR